MSMSERDSYADEYCERAQWRKGYSDGYVKGFAYAKKKYRERPHGEWAEYTVSTFRGTDGWGEPKWGKGKKFICKQCLRRTVIRENFCPSCGADMRPKEGEAE